MASRFVIPTVDVGSGIKPSSGAKLSFFETGTSTPKDTFTTAAATVANTNPVIADSNGVFPDIFITGTYKVILTDKNDVQVGFGEKDPVTAFVDLSTLVTINPATLAVAIADTSLVDGDVLHVKARSTSAGGSAIWDVVLLSTVTVSTGAPSYGNIVASTGVSAGAGALALVLREDDNKVVTNAEYGATAVVSLNDALSNNDVLDLVDDISTDEVVIVRDSFISNGKELTLSGVDKPTIQVGNGATQDFNCVLRGVKASGPQVQATNNNAVITARLCEGAFISDFEVTDGYNSFSLEHGDLVAGERRASNCAVSNGLVRGTLIGYEMFSPYTSHLNGIASRAGLVQGIQHGLRLTGFGKDHLAQGNDLRNLCNYYEVVVDNYANGISLQTGTFGNIINAPITACLNGLASTDNQTLADAISSSNVFTVAISECDNGSLLVDPSSSIFTGTSFGCTVSAWDTNNLTRGAKSNIYNLALKNSLGSRFEDSFSIINLTSNELNNAAVVTGDSNIINATFNEINNVSGTSPGITLSGDNNILNITTNELNHILSQVTISGNNNIITVNLVTASGTGIITVSGTGNKVIGDCIVAVTSNSANNYDGVTGFMQADNFTATTDAGGRFTLPLTVPFATFAIDLNVIDFNKHYTILLTGQSTSNATFIAYDQAGAVVNADTFNTRWSLHAFL